MKRGGAACAAVSLAALGTLFLPWTALADGYNIQVWQPVHDGSGAITTQGLTTMDEWSWRTGASVDYAHQPLLVVFPGGTTPLLDGATTAELGVMLGLPGRFVFELDAPYANHHVIDPLGANGNLDAQENGVGDLRVGLKRTWFEGGDYVPGFGAGASLDMPTGNSESWYGSGVVEGRAYGIMEERLGPVMLDGNLGLILRPRTAVVWGQQVGNSISANGGLVWDTGLSKLQVVGDWYGNFAFSSGQLPFEIGGALRREIIPGMSGTLGADRGIGGALGTPSYRVFGMLNIDASTFHHHIDTDVVVEPVVRPEPAEPQSEPAAAPWPTAVAVPTPSPVEAAAEPPQVTIVHVEPAQDAALAPVVKVTEASLVINQSIHFELMLWEIKKDSFPILSAVANTLRAHPEIEKIRIEGHTDSTGSDLANDTISKFRAIAVKNYLVRQGIDPARIDTVGLGPHRPIASNRTKEGRAQNRRVEFNIVRRSGESPASPERP